MAHEFKILCYNGGYLVTSVFFDVTGFLCPLLSIPPYHNLSTTKAQNPSYLRQTLAVRKPSLLPKRPPKTRTDISPNSFCRHEKVMTEWQVVTVYSHVSLIVFVCGTSLVYLSSKQISLIVFQHVYTLLLYLGIYKAVIFRLLDSL